MSKNDTPANADPMKLWREWFVKNERDWSEAITRMIKDDTVSQGLGKEFNASLVQQQALSRSMAEFFATLNLPTREDFTAIGERIGQLEDAVARVEAMLVQMKRGAAADAPRPARTRQPPGQPPGKLPGKTPRKTTRKTAPAARHEAD